MPNKVVCYIQENFLTLRELAERTGATEESILHLIESQCIPRHSYEIAESTTVKSFFGEREVSRTAVRYYPTSHLERIGEAMEAATQSSPNEFAKAVRAAFFSEYQNEIAASGLLEDGLLREGEVEPLLESEWAAWLDGTYGLCTLRATARDVARKELSILRIKGITDDARKESLTDPERRRAREAIEALDAVASFFAPDEREDSSRERWINRIVRKYRL
jgi:uncharacterized protein DUF6058